MKKRSSPAALVLLLLLTTLTGWAQSSVPLVPDRMTFADISVRLDDDARRIVQQDVNALLANRQYWTAKLDRVVLYFPVIEAILINEDVPTDFKYLAVQESSLTPDAVSSSSAVGYWQFKRETAMGLGMRVDDDIDERKSITASTHGAAQYLKKSNAQFNNWIASLYSYYLGAGGIAKLIPPDWAYAREVALDGRTDRYILRFFAHKLAIESALKYHQTSNRFALLEYPGANGKTFKSVADELGVDEFELRKYNRWALGDAIPTDKSYALVIPVASEQINEVRQKIVSVSPRRAVDAGQVDVGFPVLRRVTTGLSGKNDPILYEINGLPGIQAQPGDNGATLARKSKISLSSFLRYNDLNENDPILPGDVYYLAKKRKKALVPFHTVREGETSRSISQRYGLRLKKLMRYNRLDRMQKLATGRVMWLRERRPASKPVEIITAPTPPVYDQTPAPPARTDVADNGTPANQPARAVAGSDNIPRDPSERKKYQPKLVGGGVTPNDGTSQPATTQPIPEPAPSRPDGWSTGSTGSGVNKNRKANRTTQPAPVSSEGSQRVIIVRTPTTPGSAEPAETRAVPVATTPERVPAAAADNTPAPKSGSTTGTYAPAKTSRPAVQDDDLQPVRTPATVTKATPKTAPPVLEEPAPAPKTAPAPAAVNRSASTHTVEPGQTYYSISRLYGLTVDELLTLNNLTTDQPLSTGRVLIVKASAAKENPPAKVTTRPAATSESGTVYHTVVKGETMYRISKEYGVTVDQIREWNNLPDTNVKLGQRLKIVKP